MSSPSIENLEKSAIIRYIPKQFHRAYPFSLYTNRHVLYRGKRASPRNPVCISVFGSEGATCPEYSVPACAAEARCKYAPKGFFRFMGMRPPSRYDLYGICPGQVSYKCLTYGSWSTVLGIPGAVFLSAWADSQCVTNCAGQIRAFGPLDRSLLPARRMEFAGMPRWAMRARCGCYRYPFTLLGIAPAVTPVPILSAWADSQCVTNCAGQIRAFGPLDRSLLPARRMEFAGMPRRAMRARCGCYRYPFTLLGIVPAVNPVPFCRHGPTASALRTAPVKFQFGDLLLWRGSAHGFPRGEAVAAVRR